MLLNGGLQGVFAGAFGSIYLPGTLWRVRRTEGAGGTFTETPIPTPCRVQVDSATEAMRGDAGYSDRDVSILILQGGLVGPAPTTDDQVTAKGVRWALASVIEDPASTYWLCRATPR